MTGLFSDKWQKLFSGVVRETDLTGWFEEGNVIGVLFTESGTADVSSAFTIIETKVKAGLQRAFKSSQLGHLRITLYIFPEDSAEMGRRGVVTTRLYPDLFETEKKKKVSLLIKGAMDVVGSITALVFLSPVFLVLALLDQADLEGTSPVPSGTNRTIWRAVCVPEVPVHAHFECSEIHKEFVHNFIAGKSNPPLVEKECENRLQNHQRSSRHLDRQVHASYQHG